MSGFGRFVFVFGVMLLAAVGIGSVLASPGGVLPGGSDDDQSSVQSGGIVSVDQLAALSSSSSDDNGDEVKVLGDVLVCPSSGKTVQAKFEREGDKFEVKGTLLSLNGTEVVVEVTGAGDVPGPDGVLTGGELVTAQVTRDTKIEGAPVAGDIVEVKGTVDGTPSFVADKIENECKDEVKVLGDVLECPSGKQVQAKFEREGDKFEVKGTLLSLNGTEVVVEVTGAGDVPGPDGQPSGSNVVTADASGAEIKGDPQVGDIVEVKGTVDGTPSFVADKIENKCEDENGDEIVGDVFTCPSGEQKQFKFEQHEDKFEVKGTLVSLSATEVQVTGPGGVPGGNPVVAAVDSSTEVKGDPQIGDFVEVEGSVLGDGGFLAHEVKNECEDENGDENGDEVKVLGDVLECPSSDKTVQAKFEREGDKFEVKGTLVSLNGTVTVEVTGAGDVPGPDGQPSGSNVVTADASGAEIKGDPQVGDIVEVKGTVDGTPSFVADKIENECGDENGDHSGESSGDHDSQSNDGDHNDGDHHDEGNDSES